MQSFTDTFKESFSLLKEELGQWFDTFITAIPNFVLAVIVGVIAYFLSTYVKKLAVKSTKSLRLIALF